MIVTANCSESACIEHNYIKTKNYKEIVDLPCCVESDDGTGTKALDGFALQVPSVTPEFRKVGTALSMSLCWTSSKSSDESWCVLDASLSEPGLTWIFNKGWVILLSVESTLLCHLQDVRPRVQLLYLLLLGQSVCWELQVAIVLWGETFESSVNARRHFDASFRPLRIFCRCRCHEEFSSPDRVCWAPCSSEDM